MNLSWVLPRSWLRRRRPAAQPQAEPPQRPEAEQPQRPAAEPPQRSAAEPPRPDTGLPSWRRLPVLTVTVNSHRPVTGDGRAAVAGTRSLLARPAGRPGMPLVRGRSDALVTASPLRPAEEHTPFTADTAVNGGAAMPGAAGMSEGAGVSGDAVFSGDASSGDASSGGAVPGGGAVAPGGDEGAPAVTAYRAVPVAGTAPRRLPVLPETSAGPRPRADLTRATAESVGLPRPVTPPPPRSEFAQRLDAFRPDWLRAEMESELPHYVRARAADTARPDGPAAGVPSGPAMPRPGGGFSPPGRFRPTPAGPAGARMPSGPAAGPDRPDAGAVPRPPTVFRRTVHRGADGAPRSGSGTSGAVPSAEQSRGEEPEGDGAPPSGSSRPDTERRTQEDGPSSEAPAPHGDGPSSEAPAPHGDGRPAREGGEHRQPAAGPVAPEALRSVRRLAESAGPATGDAEAAAAREGARAPQASSPGQGPAAGEASAAPGGGPHGSGGSREGGARGGAGGPDVPEAPGASGVLRHVARSGRPSSRAEDADDAMENASAPASVPASARPADDRVVPPPPFAPFVADGPGGLSAPDAAPSDASAHVSSEDGESAAPDTSGRADGSGAAYRSTVPAGPQVPKTPWKPRHGTAGGTLSATARPSRPPVKPRPRTAATPSDAPGTRAVPPVTPTYAAPVPDHRAPVAAPRHRPATTGADNPATGPVTHTTDHGPATTDHGPATTDHGPATTDHGPATSSTAAVPHSVAGRSPGGAVLRGADAARPAGSAKAATVAVLAPHLAHRFERELGMPVSGVVVRRDAEATVRAKRLGARAFTENGTVFLPEAAGPLDGPDGGALLAHELVHAVQQATRPVAARATGEEDVVMEAEAVMAERWARGHPVRLRHPRPAAPPPPLPAAEQAGDVVQRAPLAAPPSVDAAAPPEDPQPAGHDHMPVPDAARTTRYPDPGAERQAQRLGALFADGSLEARLAELAEVVTGLRRRRCVQLDHPVHLDALADLLYERVSAHLRREMVVERERHGLLTFPA